MARNSTRPAEPAPGAVPSIESGEALGTPTITQTPPRGALDAAEGGEPPSAPSDPVEAAKASVGEGTEEPPKAPAPEEPQLPEPGPVLVAAAQRYRVGNPNVVTVSWRGQSCRMHPGDIVSEDSYGDGAIELFRQAGLKLDAVD